MRIKVNIDRHGLSMWLSRSRRVTAFKLHFCSQEHVLKRFSLFVKDDRRFCKICFQQRLIVYQTPLFHQYLFDIFNCRVGRCNERQYTFVTFRPLCILMADCLEASWPLTETFQRHMMFSECLLLWSVAWISSGPLQMFILIGRVSFKLSYCLPLMKPYFTPGGWHHRRPKLTSREKANN